MSRTSMPLLILALAGAAVVPGVAQDVTFRHTNTPENLKSLFERIHQAAHVKKDSKTATALFRSLGPDASRLKHALREDVPADAVTQILDMHKRMPIGEADVVRLARPQQSVVQVHAATTEQIAKYERDSTAYKEFPGGAKRLAEQLLRPGVTFYEVEYLEPGKDAGMKYHLLYWDGKQWSMLGPIWRVIQ